MRFLGYVQGSRIKHIPRVAGEPGSGPWGMARGEGGTAQSGPEWGRGVPPGRSGGAVPDGLGRGVGGLVQGPGGQVGVPLRHRGIGMAEDLLNLVERPA
jgi:hypothetical protein